MSTSTNTTEDLESRNLPAVPHARVVNVLDLAQIEEALPDLRAGLESAIRAAATAVRQSRGEVVTAEDTFDLIRRLLHAQDVLGRAGKAFTDAAATCLLEVAEELSTAVGEQEGVPLGRLVVPAGTVEYVIRPDMASGTDRFDVQSLIGVLADLAVAGQPLPDDFPPQDDPGNVLEWGREVAADAMHKVLGLVSSPKWKTTAIDALRRKLAGEGDDLRAGVLGQVRVRGDQVYRGTVRVDVEEPKQRRR
jgi:hypothetical protein